MKSHLAFLLFAFLLLGGTVYPAIGQTSGNDHVVINEVDINPPGDDSLTISEWVELYNPTDSAVDVGGWKVASTTILKKTFTISQGTIIEPGGFLTYSYTKVWFTDVSELVQLRDSDDNVIDETPVITDLSNDFSSWQRTYDGIDTDTSDDWKFATSSVGSTNGKLIVEEEEEAVSVSVEINKSEFLFGETAYISGSVSEEIFYEKPFFQAAPIEILIVGPGFYKPVTLYPNLNLNFETSLSLHQVLGVSEGIYDVTVDYAGSTAQAKFSVGEELIILEEKEPSTLSISFDKESYLPGQTATAIGTTTEIVPFEGLKFKVINPNGIQIYDGTLFPNLGGGGTGTRGGEGSVIVGAQFSTQFYMNTINPVYGEHKILAEYSTQTAESSFLLLEDEKEDTLISLDIDKKFYGIGETVKITGRLNQVWVTSLDLEIIQLNNLALDGGIRSEGVLSGGGTNLKTLDVVRPLGDGSFNYEFKIPASSSSLGNYKITVSKDLGKAFTIFQVVENPDEFIDVSAPISIFVDKVMYESGDTIKISGVVTDIKERTTFEVPVIKISILNELNQPVTIIGVPEGVKLTVSSGTVVVPLEYTAIPDSAGFYNVQFQLSPSIFDEGTYFLKAVYDGKLTASTAISIIDPLNIEGFGQVDINKEVFGLGEEVIVEGIIPGISQGTGIDITLFKPDGDTDTFGVLADNSRFSWSWKTPIAEKSNVITTNERVFLTSNYGVYQVTFGTASGSVNIFFKVSPDPENDTLVVMPLEVTTDMPIYTAGKSITVLGSAQKRAQGTEGLVIQDRAHIVVKTTDFPIKEIYDAFVYLDAGGHFQSSFSLPVTIFKEGNYKVTVNYLTYTAETLFAVENEFLIGSDEELALLVDIDKDEYALGETVHLTGRPNKIIYLDKVDITIVHEDQTQITCGSFVCGSLGTTVSVVPSVSGSFTYDYTISTSDSAKGKYEIITDTDFGRASLIFDVIDKPTMIETPAEAELPVTRTTEKFNRIPDSIIPINTTPIQLAGEEMLPRVIQGSLLTTSRGDESNVNLRITTESGLCIIGQEIDCMISKSTRAPGQIYEIVSIDDMNYKIRYSGPDVRLEKFTILPESNDATLPESTWNVEVIKEDQVSRFYYKITRVAVE